MRRGQQRAAMVRERISLNPQMEEDDRREAEKWLDDSAHRSLLENVWFCVLNCGESLRRRACDMKHFKAFVVASNYGASERQISTALRCFDAQMGDDECIDFFGFVKCLFHMGMERYNTREYSVAMERITEQFLVSFLDTFRKANDHDGTGPDERLLDIREIDRLLYVYDSVLERLFNRYRDVDQHANRDLTMDQVKLLDSYVELEEVKEFMKEFGYFPKIMSFVEISRCAQYACFGKVVVDPSRQNAGYRSNIDAKRPSVMPIVPGTPLAALEESKNEDTAGAAGDGAVAARCTNPLYIPTLPPEYLTDEVLLDKPRFMSCFLRLAQAHYNKPDYHKELPSITSRVEEMLAQMAPTYEKIFGRTMESDCDFTEKGVPVLANASPTAALYPSEGPMGGAFELVVSGGNFCEKRGVFVRFGEGEHALVVRAKSITKKKVVVDAPAVQPLEVVVQVKFLHGAYKISLSRIARLRIECSNNRWQFSSTEPPQMLTFVQPLPEHTVDAEMSTKLMKLFGAVCAYDDRYNTKFMSREKWRKLKQLAELTEVPPPQGGGEDGDGFFLEAAEFHDGAHDLSLNFKGYLRVLARTLFEMHAEEWVAGLQRVSEVTMTNTTRKVEAAPRIERNEFTQARRRLALVERRPEVELDVYLGPVMCGVLRAVPGEITSACGGLRRVLQRHHPFLSFEQHDINSESVIVGHISVSHSFIHCVNRLRRDGFDFAARHPKPQTRKPAGRCWALFKQGALDEQPLGAVWDYPGNFSNLDWQPATQEMFNPNITVGVYVDEPTHDYVQLYILFEESKGIAQLRQSLEAKGYALRTKLYKLP